MISVIVHKKDDNQQFPRELFRSCLHDANQKRNTTGFQTFDKGPFLLSLHRATKKNLQSAKDHKVGLSSSKTVFVICLIESLLKMMKSVFFILKISKFLSRHFFHVGKSA